MVNKIESQIKENKSANRWIVLFLCGIVISWILTCTGGYIFNSLLHMPNNIKILLATIISVPYAFIMVHCSYTGYQCIKENRNEIKWLQKSLKNKDR